MLSKLSDALLPQLGELVAARMGLCFSRERRCDLERGFASAAQEFGYKDIDLCIQWLLSSSLTRSQIEILASHLTVGETYFFREKRGFQFLEEEILPELVHQRRGKDQRLRIWSAGCATGEEPYSIAMLLSKLLPDLKNWNITILATDINPHAIKKAILGVYNHWSFRDCPQWVKEKYFKEIKNSRFEISPEIKHMVIFGYHNLAEDPYPSLLNNTNAMDIIFCRNVLMYFTLENVKRVLENCYNCLIDGGWLITSPTDTVHSLYSNFTTINRSDVSVYRKDSQRSKTTQDSLPANILSCEPIGKLDILPESTSFSINNQGLETGLLSETSEPVQKDKECELLESEAARYEDALALYKQCRYLEAEMKIMGSLKRNQSNTETLVLLAQIYANQGRLPEALGLCQQGLMLDKLNPAYHYLQATILQELGRNEEACMSLKHALYLDSNFILAHFALGNLTLRQCKLKESRKHFENALSLLSAYHQEDILPESGEMTAGRLTEIIRSTTCVEKPI